MRRPPAPWGSSQSLVMISQLAVSLCMEPTPSFGWGSDTRSGMTVARHLAAADPGYAALFGEAWAACCERAADNSAPDQAEMSSRIARYLNSIGPVNNVPIGEAMVAYRERSGDEDASQTFVPFVAEVRVGAARAACLLWSWRGRVPTGAAVAARHARAARSAAAAAAGARAARAAAGLLAGESRATRSWRGAGPPGAPSPPATPAPHDLQPPPLLAREPLELQLDYWLVSPAPLAAGGGRVPPARPSPPATPYIHYP
ncbi:hypothetical protein MSG28_007130 [Choristoneura fumiferana]|uniref:Uncharacterized protein n=1 Tax=Choristoneura fumiferana TaxID=7141 RepID=A0ACC0JMY1_CHOFU|nr:hypothetical protein MSG28_007130 [Choristoneura fumiferana]